MGVWLSGDKWQDTTLSNLALMYLKKGKFSQICLCRCKKHYIFSSAGKNGKIYICTCFGLWAQICTKMCFCWGHVGLVVFVFLGPPHLALNSPYFCRFVFFLFFFVFVCFLVLVQCLPFFLLCVPFSLSLSLSLFLSLSLYPYFLSSFLVPFLFFCCFLVWGLSFLPCFLAFVSWNEQLPNSKLESFLS